MKSFISRLLVLALGVSLLGPSVAAQANPKSALPPSVGSKQTRAAADLLARALQQAGLPAEGLWLLHERVRVLDEEGGQDGYETETWADLKGDRLKLTDSQGPTLDSVHLLTPQQAVVYTPSGGTVPVPRQTAAQLRQHLRMGLLGLSGAEAAGVKLQASRGPVTWVDSKTLRLSGTVLEATWPDGTEWHFLIDEETGRLLADRSGDEQWAELILYYGDVQAGTASKGSNQPAARDVQTLLLPDGTVLYREEVLVRELNPTLPAGTFEVTQ